MLQFWRKSGHKNPALVESHANIGVCSRSNSSLSPKLSPLASFDDEGLCDIDEFESQKERSKLSKTLSQVLSDKGALAYFSQYMETRNAPHYLPCWLEIEAFKLEMPDSCKSPLPVPNPRQDHDSLSVSTDSSSLCDYSDRILSETNTQITDNALIIFKKYVALEATSNIGCPEIIRNEVVENVCSSVLPTNCFDKVHTFVFDVMEKEYFDAFLSSDFFCKHQIDVLTGGNVALDDILYNETALFYFMEFLEQENSRSLLEFWIAATNLQQQLHDQKEFFDPIEAQNDAVVLYDKYFSLQAHCPLGFPDRVRFVVEQSICGENGLVIDCFHLPIKLVEQFLEKNHLKSFLASQLFYKYLSELINTVQSNGYAMNIERTASDCSSERSFSTNSTFLALEMNHPLQKAPIMSIDTRLLCDPDSLWKRRRNVLSCGRVTELGKFVTDLEPEPDRKEFRLKDVVMKIVGSEEEKKKEEMAWQVAEMIVKDITSVTLGRGT